MYWEYFGLEENPFSISPDPRYLYMSKRHQEALAHLVYGIGESGGFVLLTGEVGTGKTTVCRCLIEELPDGVELAFVLNPRVDEVGLLATICEEYKVPVPRHDATLKLLVDRLNEHLLAEHAHGRRAVLMIDEAQNLSPAVLEQVRLLTNLETTTQKLLQIVLIGQPELNDVLKRKGLRQLDQRITARYHLEPLSWSEAAGYIAHRLQVAGLADEIFTPAAVRMIYRRSGGTPRLINTICDRCLLGAYAADKRRIGAPLVHRAAAEVLGVKVRGRGAPRWLAGAAAGAAVAAAVVAGPVWLGVQSRLGSVPPAQEVADSGVEPAGAAPAQDAASSSPAAEVAEAPPAAPEPAALGAEGRGGDAPALLPPPPPPPLAGNPPVELGESASDAVAEVLTAAGPDIFETALFAAAEPAAQDAVDGASATVDSQPLEVAAPGAPLPAVEPPGSTREEGPSDLAEVIESPGAIGDMEAAVVSLFRLWRLDYERLDGVTPCRRARYAKLRCLQGRTTWHELRLADRPAVITLRAPDGRRVNAALLHLGDERAVLEIDGREVEATVAELAQLWTGDYLLLWRAPTLFDRNLREGLEGKDVAWLKDRLAEIGGEAPEGAESAVFDASLLDKVRLFQRERGLLVDGIAGPHTIIQINAASGIADVPTLR